MPDISESEEADRKHLAELRERIAEGEANLAYELEHKEVLDKFYEVLKGEFSRLSNGRPHTVRLASLLPFSLRNAFVFGRLAELVHINIAPAGRVALLAIAVKRADSQATIKYLKLNLKDDRHNAERIAKLLGEQPTPPSPP